MARAFNDIYAELGSQYDPSAQLIQQQISAMPGATDAFIKQADAKLGQANESIVEGARSRGMGFSGIPLAEQAKYAATEYAPAIANFKSGQEQNRLGMMESLNALNRERNTRAQSVYDGETARDFQERQFQEQIRQFNEQQRAAAAARASEQANIGAYLGGGQIPGQAGGAPAAAKMVKTAKGFNFVDGTGRGINAAQYAQLAGVGYRELLSQMAKAGDKNAQLGLKYVGNDGKFGNAPQTAAGALTALGAMGSYTRPNTYVAPPSNNPYAQRLWATGKF